MRELTLTAALLDPILARDPAGPRITYYNDATGARIELSALTLANWAAKTANMIRDEFGLLPGARIAVLLPAHWQTAAVLLGAWWAGAEVSLEATSRAELAFVTADQLDAVSNVPDVAALSLDAFGRPVPDLPLGVTDYATSVRVHGDQFRPHGVGPALDGMTVDEILKQTSAQGFTATDRVLCTQDWATTEALISRFIAVLAAGASLVLIDAPDPAAAERRDEAEKITARTR